MGQEPGIGDVPPPAPALPGAQGWRWSGGQSSLPPPVLDCYQRQRVLAGARRALAEHGYMEMGVEHVLEQAGISRTTFHEYFDGKRDCMLAAHQQSFDRFLGDLLAAWARAGGWPERVAASVRVAIEFAIRAPEEARLLSIDGVAGEPALVDRVLDSNALFARMLRAGRDPSQSPALPELTERALVGGVAAAIGSRLVAGQTGRIAALEPGLVQFMLIPYVGAEEARRMAVSAG